MATLEAIRDRLGLDYGGIDFGADRQGRPIVFEANATMIVPAPQDGPQWAYRRGAIERIERAFARCSLDRAAARSR